MGLPNIEKYCIETLIQGVGRYGYTSKILKTTKNDIYIKFKIGLENKHQIFKINKKYLTRNSVSIIYSITHKLLVKENDILEKICVKTQNIRI